jgi:hypothetical protein
VPVITSTGQGSNLALSVSSGSWTPAATAYQYAWTRNGSAIAGATAASYVTSTLDEGLAVAAVVTASNAAGNSSATSAAINVPVAGTSGTDPSLGANAFVYHISRGSVGPTLSAPAMNTQSGSTILAIMGKGSLFTLTAPADNKGNTPYLRLGTAHAYTKWPGEGTSAFAFNNIVGGSNHVLSIDDSNTFDEVSFSVIEVRNGGLVQAHSWIEVLDSPTHTSASVTTTGAATLVAAWFGDDASTTPSNPVPNNGFTIVHGVTGAVETVQMVVATRNVSAAGTYNVSWATTPRQGAQLYLFAVQKR